MGIKALVRGIRTSVLSTSRRLNPAWIKQQTKLNVGCGEIRVPGYLNIDASPLARGADLVCNLTELERVYPAGHAEEIYACHVLEHFSHEGAEDVLRMFHRLLRPGGKLRVSVPDMDRIARIYVDNWEHFQTPGNSPWIGLIWGGQTTPYDFHQTGFNLCWMSYLMEQIGFRDVEEYPHLPHPLGITDASLVKEPFGEFLSLNVIAHK